jgi:hypothetical protein
MRFIDAQGAPVSALLVRLAASSSAPAGSPGSVSHAQRDLAVVRTDASGYCSVKLDRAALGDATQVLITYGTGSCGVHALSLAQLVAADAVQTLTLDPTVKPVYVRQLGLPSITAPDLGDVAASPGSIGKIPQITADGGICSQLMPTMLRVRRYPAYTVHADICHPQTVSCRDAVQFVRGTMLEYEVSWNPQGTALGELLHTVTLAPCEQVNIAVVDWIRREVASQSQSTQVQQQALQSMTRDRLITEAMTSSVNTKSSAWSFGGTIGASIPIDSINLTASLGGGMSSATYSQQAAVNTTSRLAESIQQSATFVASQRSTVVFNATVSEQQISHTSTVRNNNHCHALTMEYFEINESYSVETAFKGWRNVILIKYDNADFTPERIAANADILKAGLLDPSLLSAFDLLTPGANAGAPGDPAASIDTVTVTFQLGLAPATQITGGMLTITLTIAGRAPIEMAWSPVWPPSAAYQATIPVSPPIHPSQLLRVDIQAFATVLIHLDSENLYTTGPIASSLQIMGTGSGSSATILFSDPSVAFPPTGTWSHSFSGGATGVVSTLLAHFNRNKRRYNELLWFAEDPNDRVTRWSCCSVSTDPFSVLDLIENDPLTVYGDFVVFPAAGTVLNPDPTVPVTTKLITLPTSGVFAEGIIGQCNTCEVLDSNRFWDWKSSPCPDNAPAVTSAPQAGVAPGSLKPDAISNMITFAAVPDAGQSALKDILTSLVAQADGGSKSAQDLLGKLFDALKASVGAASAKPAAPADPKK